MARIFRNHPEYVLGLVLLAAVIVVAGVRTQGLGIAFGAEPVAAVAEPSEYAWFDAGMEIWDADCYGCHADLTYIPELFMAEGGRDYLNQMLIVGVRGEVNILGSTRNLRHAAYGGMFDDEELSAVLNLMLVAWGNDEELPDDVEFYTAEEVAEARAKGLDQAAVLEMRPNPWE